MFREKYKSALSSPVSDELIRRTASQMEDCKMQKSQKSRSLPLSRIVGVAAAFAFVLLTGLGSILYVQHDKDEAAPAQMEQAVADSLDAADAEEASAENRTVEAYDFEMASEDDGIDKALSGSTKESVAESITEISLPEKPITGTFSFDDALATYKVNDPGVYYDGFKNTSEFAVSNEQEALERAKRECTVEYDRISVSYDEAEDIWRIVFWLEGTLGGNQDVYLDSNGVTHLIVYGE